MEKKSLKTQPKLEAVLLLGEMIMPHTVLDRTDSVKSLGRVSVKLWC